MEEVATYTLVPSMQEAQQPPHRFVLGLSEWRLRHHPGSGPFSRKTFLPPFHLNPVIPPLLRSGIDLSEKPHHDLDRGEVLSTLNLAQGATANTKQAGEFALRDPALLAKFP